MKLWSLVLCGALVLTMTACSSNKPEDVAEAELPYGATLITDSEKGEVPITYDRRFFNEDEITTLSSYFYALESMDEALLDETTLDLYTDFVVDAMYQGLIGFDGLLTQMNGSFAVAENVPYTITEVEITDYFTIEEHANTDLENLYNMLDELDGEENFYSHISGEGKYLTYTIKTESNGESKVFTDQRLFLIQVDGAYTICS